MQTSETWTVASPAAVDERSVGECLVRCGGQGAEVLGGFSWEETARQHTCRPDAPGRTPRRSCVGWARRCPGPAAAGWRCSWRPQRAPPRTRLSTRVATTPTDAGHRPSPPPPARWCPPRSPLCPATRKHRGWRPSPLLCPPLPPSPDRTGNDRGRTKPMTRDSHLSPPYPPHHPPHTRHPRNPPGFPPPPLAPTAHATYPTHERIHKGKRIVNPPPLPQYHLSVICPPSLLCLPPTIPTPRTHTRPGRMATKSWAGCLCVPLCSLWAVRGNRLAKSLLHTFPWLVIRLSCSATTHPERPPKALSTFATLV